MQMCVVLSGMILHEDPIYIANADVDFDLIAGQSAEMAQGEVGIWIESWAFVYNRHPYTAGLLSGNPIHMQRLYFKDKGSSIGSAGLKGSDLLLQNCRLYFRDEWKQAI
jgi:hypothetical protein